MSVNMQITEIAVTALPIDHPDAWHFTVLVQYRGHDKYAVVHAGKCLGADGTFDYEPSSSNRDEEWLSSHRFDWDDARDRAAKVAPTLTCNGWTVERVLAREDP